MTTVPRINNIAVQGFRSFGKTRQVTTLSETITVFWGGNSQGKTSLTEAIEFLFTGQIARRELLASAKDEFSESLKNAHIDPATSTHVEAEIRCQDGVARKLRRTLKVDYQRGSAASCVTILEIDGSPASEQDISEVLGVRLSQAPLRAPVLAQHTLGYLFSASPSDRATYFRAILDTQDLEDFRNAVANLAASAKVPNSAELEALEIVATIKACAVSAALLRKADSAAQVEQRLLDCCRSLLTNCPDSLPDAADSLDAELADRRARTFPVQLFARGQFTAWSGTTDSLQTAWDSLREERARIDAETRRLLALFQSALELPHIHSGSPQDCPLCGAAETLSAERVRYIAGQVEASADFTKALERLSNELHALELALTNVKSSANAAMPSFWRSGFKKRRSAGFSSKSIRTLVPDAALVASWLSATKKLARAARRLSASITTVLTLLKELEAAGETADLDHVLRTAAQVVSTQADFVASNAHYTSVAQVLEAALTEAVDEGGDLSGWEELIALARKPDAVWRALQDLTVHKLKLKELEKAVGEIDAANGTVADNKLAELSAGVSHWWNLLRPDESTYFDGVQRRSPKARKIIDLKVGMKLNDDPSTAKMRDAIAVLSQSQLHCLGLSLFLARCVNEGSGFVVLDDPVLTSDDDYRPNFTSAVIQNLHSAGLQVIIATQDHTSWKDIGHRWQHLDALQLQLVRPDPLGGTEVRNQSDTLATMLARAAPLTRSPDPEVRKAGAVRVREAIERFCKMLLVQKRQAEADTLASITDYDGKNFSNYGAEVMALLVRDPSHPGKLRAAHNYVTPGPHDDTPPSQGELRTAYGDVKMLKSTYLL